jgi:hypothetical protein
MQIDIAYLRREHEAARQPFYWQSPTVQLRPMELSKKIKTALDETRMLILGAQILLGFELRAAFSESFDQLPASARHLEALALMLMTVAVALMITPGTYHRIVEGGRDSGAFHEVTTIIADISLFPFALALGLDLFVSIEHVCGRSTGMAAGIGATLAALAMWYGMPRAMARRTGQKERAMTEAQRDEQPRTPLHVKIEQMLTEARVILPGAQALFGFQLAIVLTRAFEDLPDLSRLVHAVSLGLVALSVMLLMAPAAYHRIVYAGEDSPDMHRVGSAMVTAATAPLALGLAGDIYVVIGKIIGLATGLAAAGLALFVLITLWYGYPLAVALHRRGAPAGRAQAKASGQRS